MSKKSSYKQHVILKNKMNMVTYHKASPESDTVIVAFGEIDSNLSYSGFASNFSFELGVDYVYVAQRPGTQYQFLDEATLSTTLKTLTKNKRIITYGSSLGAYCAIYYAGSLGADVLAFSPRIPAHPAIDSLMRNRFRNRGFKHKEISEVTLTSGHVNIFYDPRNSLDSFYTDIFLKKSYPHASYHHIQGAGHYTARALSLSGCLKQVVLDFLDNKDISFHINHQAVLDWNKKAIKRRLRRNSLGHALENLEAISASPKANLSSLSMFFKKVNKEQKSIIDKTSGKLKRNNKIFSRLGSKEKDILQKSTKILFVGDLILLRPQLLNSFDKELNEYNFKPMFRYVKKYIENSNYSIGVFEGPTAGDNYPLSTSSYADGIPLRLNYPDCFAKDVKEAGFDLVTLAQNHLLDCGVEGALRTIEVLNKQGLDHIGCYREEEEKNLPKIIYINDLKIGILAYTKPSNGYESDFFFKGKGRNITSTLVGETDKNFHKAKEIVINDFKKLKALNPDCIIVLPHMGAQFRHSPDKSQNLWCNIFINEGADLILSDHPHAVQPFEWRENPQGRKSLILHCPGNFVNSYTKKDGDISALVQIHLDSNTGEPLAASATPLYAHAYYGKGHVPIPIHQLINGDKSCPTLSQYEYDRVKRGHEIFSESMLKERLPIDHIQEKYYIFSHHMSKDNRLGYMRSPVEPISIHEPLEKNLFIKALKNSRCVCFVGDSITEGTVNGGYGWFEPLMENFPSIEVKSFAKGSQTSSYFLARAQELAEAHADIYIIAIGANDIRYRDPKRCAMTAEQFIKNISKITDRIIESLAAKIFIIAPWCSDDHDPISTLKKPERDAMRMSYSLAIKEYCESRGLFFIDPNPFILDNFRKKDPRFWLLDHIHPNAHEGIRMYSKAVVSSAPQIQLSTPQTAYEY